MSAPQELIALVPMRHESERVAGKNYRTLGGRPLFHHIVETLLQVSRVSEVVIDTDSDLIAQDAAASFDRVRVIERPPALRGGGVPMNEVLLHDVDALGGDWFLQTHSTNPLLCAATIDRALDALFGASQTYDSLFAVTRVQARLWWGAARAINHDPAVLLRTQDLPPVFQECSSLYVFQAEMLRRHGSRIGERPLLFEIDREEGWDIDEELDFRVAECLWSQRER